MVSFLAHPGRLRAVVIVSISSHQATKSNKTGQYLFTSMEFPIFKCVIDESLDSDLQVEFVALVDKPAIEKNFLAFNEKLRFTVDAERKIVSGPAMLADMMIY